MRIAPTQRFYVLFHVPALRTAEQIRAEANAYCATHFGGEDYDIEHLETRAEADPSGYVLDYAVEVIAKRHTPPSKPPPVPPPPDGPDTMAHSHPRWWKCP